MFIPAGQSPGKAAQPREEEEDGDLGLLNSAEVE